MLGLGLVAAAVGLRASGQRVRRTRYRPDPWRGAEWLVAGSGLVACAVGFLAGSVDAINLVPSLYPLSWPQLPVVSSIAVLVAALPAVVAPRPARRDLAPRPAMDLEQHRARDDAPTEPLVGGGARR